MKANTGMPSSIPKSTPILDPPSRNSASTAPPRLEECAEKARRWHLSQWVCRLRVGERVRDSCGRQSGVEGGRGRWDYSQLLRRSSHGALLWGYPCLPLVCSACSSPPLQLHPRGEFTTVISARELSCCFADRFLMWVFSFLGESFRRIWVSGTSWERTFGWDAFFWPFRLGYYLLQEIYGTGREDSRVFDNPVRREIEDITVEVNCGFCRWLWIEVWIWPHALPFRSSDRFFMWVSCVLGECFC